jgi:hypothetical protein
MTVDDYLKRFKPRQWAQVWSHVLGGVSAL